MGKHKSLLYFVLVLIVLSLIVFGIHTYILIKLGHDPFSHLIIEAYLMNSILALFIFVTLYLLRKKMNTQLGFLFLGGSMLKFLIFFIFFNPVYKSDGVVETMEFTSFFIPYFLALVIETFFTARMLNKL